MLRANPSRRRNSATLRTAQVLTVVALTALVFLLRESSDAQVTKGKTRHMQTKHWMKGVMGPNCGALKKGLEAGPKDDEAWAQLLLHAALLNEGSYVLMEDGRCPDEVWTEAASKTLRNESAKVIEAVEARDADAAKASFKAMTAACGSCHKAHKGKKKGKEKEKGKARTRL